MLGTNCSHHVAKKKMEEKEFYFWKKIIIKKTIFGKYLFKKSIF